MGGLKTITGIALALGLLVGAVSYALRNQRAASDVGAVHFDALPMQVERFLGSEERFDSATYTVLAADTTTLRRYVDETGSPTWLFVAYFGAQNFGEQIHSPRNCLPGGGWNVISATHVEVEDAANSPVLSNRLLIESEGARQVMYYYFVTRLGTVASEYRLKFELARAALTLQPRDALFVRVSSPVREDGEDAADLRCRSLLATAMPLLSRGLPF